MFGYFFGIHQRRLALRYYESRNNERWCLFARSGFNVVLYNWKLRVAVGTDGHAFTGRAVAHESVTFLLAGIVMKVTGTFEILFRRFHELRLRVWLGCLRVLGSC